MKMMPLKKMTAKEESMHKQDETGDMTITKIKKTPKKVLFKKIAKMPNKTFADASARGKLRMKEFVPLTGKVGSAKPGLPTTSDMNGVESDNEAED